jgi:hypothetical protein
MTTVTNVDDFALGTDPLVDVPVRDLDGDGRTLLDLLSFPSVTAKVKFLAHLATAGAYRSDRFGVGRLARELGTLEKCHAWVRDSVRYAREPEEKLESAAYIASTRAGDCDGQAVCLGSMVIALGMTIALVPMGGTPDDPSHLATAVGPMGACAVVARWQPFGLEAPRGWIWTETTIAAFYGEVPAVAADRLGVGREDLR